MERYQLRGCRVHIKQQLPEEAASWQDALSLLRALMSSNEPQMEAYLIFFLHLNPTVYYINSAELKRNTRNFLPV